MIYVVTAILVALLSLGGIAGALIGGVLSFAATYVVQAALIKAVQDVRDGRVDLDLSQTVRAAGPYILPVIGASILAGIGIAIGFILLIVPGLILLTYWCLIVPFIVIAGAGVFESFGRSMRTVRGYAWRVFGTYVLVFLMLIAVAIVLGFILLLLPLWLRSFVNSVLSGTLIAPFLALVATLIYYRLTAAHAGQPYTPTGPAGAPVWQPPYPTTARGPAGPYPRRAAPSQVRQSPRRLPSRTGIQTRRRLRATPDPGSVTSAALRHDPTASSCVPAGGALRLLQASPRPLGRHGHPGKGLLASCRPPAESGRRPIPAQGCHPD